MRHIFVAALLLAMGCWFAYDGYVTYPSMTPAELYEKIERAKPPSEEAAVRVYNSAIPRQKQFMALCLIGSLIVGVGVFRSWRFDFEYDETGFTWKGRRMSIGDIKSVNASKWAKKGVLRLVTPAGGITLDAWHNKGVDGFAELLKASGRL